MSASHPITKGPDDSGSLAYIHPSFPVVLFQIGDAASFSSIISIHTQYTEGGIEATPQLASLVPSLMTLVDGRLLELHAIHPGTHPTDTDDIVFREIRSADIIYLLFSVKTLFRTNPRSVIGRALRKAQSSTGELRHLLFLRWMLSPNRVASDGLEPASPVLHAITFWVRPPYASLDDIMAAVNRLTEEKKANENLDHLVPVDLIGLVQKRNEILQERNAQNLNKLNDRQSKLEEGQSKLIDRQSKLEEGQSKLEKDLKEVKDDLTRLEGKVDEILILLKKKGI